MQLSEFDYELPETLIAQEPAATREASRMLAVDRRSGKFTDDEFVNLHRHLKRGDLLVLNNTRVFPARLLGISETSGRVEIFLVKQLSTTVWECLARPARRLRAGKLVAFGEHLNGTITQKLSDGRVEVEFNFTGDFNAVLDAIGKTPLPPYIKRTDGSDDADRERYQTVYARSSGAIAAPTAGLHFTEHVLNEIKSEGVEVVEITLHVGHGTFEPVRATDLSRHTVLPERYEINGPTAETLNRARQDNRRIVAVGTTTTRTLENAISTHGAFVAETNEAALTITPGFRFAAVGALLTNFHLPPQFSADPGFNFWRPRTYNECI